MRSPGNACSSMLPLACSCLLLFLLAATLPGALAARPVSLSSSGGLHGDQSVLQLFGDDDKKHTVCETGDWRKSSLKLIKEGPFIGLFRELHEQTKFEASAVTIVDEKYYVVFDSIQSIGYIDPTMTALAEDNVLIGEIGEESQFEGLAYRPDTGTFFALKESHEHQGKLKPQAIEIKISDDKSKYELLRKCDVEFELSSANKGFEGISYHDKGDDGKFLLGLCEGNFCEGGAKGREAGNGRVVVSKLEESDGSCRFVPVKTIEIPGAEGQARFTDYSGMAFRDDRVAVISQEDAALWIGKFNWDDFSFDTSDAGGLYYFPKDHECKTVYCNVEGIAWIDDHRFVTTSDSAKADQPYTCTIKDQSLHIFALPMH
eukprot:jgi/Chlat1/8702/Chrsp88S08072